ncbi:MAG: hypothetical protein K9J74_11355 [Sulfuritalea sp.]|nr:hypothetical protein [Sulfuritalea sp.]
MTASNSLKIATAVRNACVRAALDAYENAQIAGLCQEGAWEVAIDAMRTLDIRAVTEAAARQDPDPASHGPASA